ncbi:hypothetical protein chiPu_0023338 [Chiloscyllium punctatum]|uniref:Uncharacterized protein n=1 Tax=Chiloscyllium punctatum TaxID=137246 RepID=A0A401T8M7_CHIPU|nr:hypothetical protein [Chiloscyllium punctatum]
MQALNEFSVRNEKIIFFKKEVKDGKPRPRMFSVTMSHLPPAGAGDGGSPSTVHGLTQQLFLLLLGHRRGVQEMGEDSGEGVGGERLGAVHLPEQVEGGEPLLGAGQQVGLLQQHDERGADSEMVMLGEVVMEGGGEALEGVTGRFLTDDADQAAQLLRSQSHGARAREAERRRRRLHHNNYNKRPLGVGKNKQINI